MATGRPLKSSSVEGAVIQVTELDVPASSAVNDLVRISETLIDTAEIAVDNIDPRVAVGVIRSKITATRARIALSGVMADPDATGPGIIYLSASGRFTSTAPAIDYQQKLGFSFGNGLIDFKPDKTHVKKIP